MIRHVLRTQSPRGIFGQVSIGHKPFQQNQDEDIARAFLSNREYRYQEAVAETLNESLIGGNGQDHSVPNGIQKLVFIQYPVTVEHSCLSWLSLTGICRYLRVFVGSAFRYMAAEVGRDIP